MGLSPEQFLLMWPADFWMKLQGFRQGREEDFRVDAELARLQTTELINIQIDPNKRIKPTQLWKFPWDEKEIEETLVTQEEAGEHLQSLIEALNKKENGRNSSNIS